MCAENRDFKSKYVIFGSSKKSFTEVNHQNRNKSTFKAEGRKSAHSAFEKAEQVARVSNTDMPQY